MWQRYTALITSAQPLGWVHEHTRAASGAASERAACESLDMRHAKHLPRRLRMPAVREQAPKQITSILLHQDHLSKRNTVCVGAVFKHLPCRYPEEPLNPNSTAHGLASGQQQLSSTNSLGWISTSSSDTNNHKQMSQQLSN